jgi:hypothetical protein
VKTSSRFPSVILALQLSRMIRGPNTVPSLWAFNTHSHASFSTPAQGYAKQRGQESPPGQDQHRAEHLHDFIKAIRFTPTREFVSPFIGTVLPLVSIFPSPNLYIVFQPPVTRLIAKWTVIVFGMGRQRHPFPGFRHYRKYLAVASLCCPVQQPTTSLIPQRNAYCTPGQYSSLANRPPRTIADQILNATTRRSAQPQPQPLWPLPSNRIRLL